MNLEQKTKAKKVISRVPSHEVLKKVHEGKKFIPVEEDFTIPVDGYTLLDMKYLGDSSKVLVPHSLLYYVANQGEGMADDALDELGDFYEEGELYEEETIRDGKTNVQEANLVTDARKSYHVYLINKLVSRKDGGEDIEFDEQVIRDLDLDDEYVTQRVKAIAAITLGKTHEEIKESDISQLLEHHSTQKVEKIGKAEFYKITKKRLSPKWDRHTKTMRCLADSHYDLLPEYQNRDDVDYDLRTMTKVVNQDITTFNQQIGTLEEEIAAYRKEKHGEIKRHDQGLIRMYTNMAYIAKENPQAQLDITPAKNGNNKKS